DILPITFLVAAYYYFYLGFDKTLAMHFDGPAQTQHTRLEFLVQRSEISQVAFAIYLLYATVLESTPWQATFGKRLVGIRVTNSRGRRLGFAWALGRNLAKLVSGLPLGLGYLWALFSEKKLTWHDMLSDTTVTESE
ncbi:MAG: RDD family protein, partial [Pirellulaceae bacterium]